MGIPAARAIHDPLNAVLVRNFARYSLIVKLVTAASIVTCPLWLGALFLTSPQDYSYASSLIFVPLLAIVGAVMVAHLSQRDPYLRRLLMAGLVAHMAASGVFLWVGFFVYGAAVDAFHYWTVGLQIAEEFQIIGWHAFHGPYWSTNLINSICGIATLLIGDALPTLFVAFALVSLAGGYVFYRTFTIAFPDGDRWLFGLLVVLLPSLLFWSSFVGKDALIQYSIALTCFGFARLTLRPGPTSVLLCAAGLAGALLIRAHVAAMLAIAMTFPYAVGRSRAGGASKGARILLIPVLLGGTYFLISQAQSFLYADTNSDNSSSVFQEANTVTKNSQIGGSSFNEGTSLPVRIAESPFLMFRPFPWEIHNVMAIASAAESVGFMILCWGRRREIWLTLRHWRDPYVGFLLMYSGLFLITFGGAISNFGILMRQRIMVTPVVLMLVCARQKSLVRSVPRKFGKNEWLTPVGISRSERFRTGA
ncbi:MAG: hypothetical protein WA869_24165 [Alloacidobacterium sp.]|jgi:hypothetical protein